MPSFASIALRLLRQVLGGPTRDQGVASGTRTALDGHTAVAAIEAHISTDAGLGGSAVTAGADLIWQLERQRRAANQAGGAPLGHMADGPRGALAAAIGQALSGIRSTAFLSARGLAGAQDLLASARGRHLPLVLHISNQSLATHAIAMGSGHEAVHLSADSGCVLLFAANVQEAVDFTLIGRRVAELALTPCLVIMDTEQTAQALQEVELPHDDTIRRYLGGADDGVTPGSMAQRMLFGDQRRRVPRWYNTDRPVRLGDMQPPTTWGLGRAADAVFFARQLAPALEDCLAAFTALTGREYESVSAHRVEDANIVLIAQGATIETAEAVADRLRSTHKLRLGVLGLRAIRPFPATRIAGLLRGKASVIVLERVDTPDAGTPPLLRELRAAVQRSVQTAGAGSTQQTDYPAMTAAECPRFRSAIYGMGGLPLRAADLVELCARDDLGVDEPVYLGVAFTGTSSQHPKRQVLLDRLRREFPDLDRLGLHSAGPELDLRPRDALSLAVHRVSGLGGEDLAWEIACFLRQAAGGQLRGHPALLAQAWGELGLDRFTWAPEGLRDPGADMPVDLALLTAGALQAHADPLLDLRKDGLLLVEDKGKGAPWPAQLLSALRERDYRLYRITAPGALAMDPGAAPEAAGTDYLLGAAFGALLDAGLLELKTRRLLSLREQALAGLPAAQRQTRLAGFQQGLERVHRLDPSSIDSSPTPRVRAAVEPPPAVQRLGNTDDSYDSLPRFWGQTGVLYRDREVGALTADPYLASGATPPLSSSFNDLSTLRNSHPVLDPTRCDACGNCWSLCPDGAVGVGVLDPGSLLDSVIARTGADALRPVSGKLAARIVSQCITDAEQTCKFGDLLQTSWDWLQGQMPLPDERRQQINKAVMAVQEATAALPVVAAEPFAPAATREGKAQAELLFLAVNPDTCKGCGICITACEPGAMHGAVQTRRSLRDARQTWQQWERLPDTRPATVERAGQHPRPGALATATLTRRHTESLAGGDAAEPGSGERLALRLAMAVTESRQRPALDAFVQEVSGLRERITGLIRETLADALPADDLDALEQGLDSVESRQAELGTLIASAERPLGSGIDTEQLRRLVQLAKALEDLGWRLAEGRQGIGRARLGLVLAADALAQGCGVFPDNPFAVPVVMDPTGDGVQMALGLLHGQLHHWTEAFGLVRRARHELEQAGKTPREPRPANPLGWQGLTQQEREIIPPLLVIGSDGLLRGGGLSKIDRVLRSELPVRLIILNQLGLGLDPVDAPDAGARDPDLELALLALGRPQAFIAQTSLGAPDHLTRSLRDALAAVGPALLHLHAPSPSRHGFATDQTLVRAEQAVRARVFPLFRYDPRAAGVFGSRFDLEGNPDPMNHWAGDADDSIMTPASWALGEQRFADCFSPLRGDEPEPLPVGDYLALDASVRQQRTAVAQRAGEDGSTVRLKVSDALIRVCEQRQAAWQALQEIAGLVTPFTARVEQAARDRVAADHEAELAALRDQYETRIAALKAEMLENTRQTMRQRMMQLAGYTGADGSSKEGAPN